MDHQLEVIAFDIESCGIAQSSGVHRIELCDNPADGGTTASYGFIEAARRMFSRQLYPIIRPRGGDFLYNAYEFDIMKTDIRQCRQMGCDGVVTGILQADGKIDEKRNSKLVDIAYPMGVTFHRAFDRTADPFEAMESIINIGFERILTSGQYPTAMEGIGLIAELVNEAGARIIIMPGSGIRSSNITEIVKKTGAFELHSSARTLVPSKMTFHNDKMNETPSSVGLDMAEIELMLKLLRAATPA